MMDYGLGFNPQQGKGSPSLSDQVKTGLGPNHWGFFPPSKWLGCVEACRQGNLHSRLKCIMEELNTEIVTIWSTTLQIFKIINILLWSSGLEFLVTDPEVRVRFPTLPHFQRSSGSGTGFTQPCEYN
jgi:hypothetical protein